ncbi:MAG: trypsin-like peptidase domain-containing protein [Patescibacteria group bacterium]|jgi:serine protease Do
MENNQLRQVFFFGFLGACTANAVLILGAVSYAGANGLFQDGRFLSPLGERPGEGTSGQGDTNSVIGDGISRQNSVVTTVASANPAVVSIVISKDVPVMEQYFENYNPFGGNSPGFQIPQYRQNGTKKQEVGGGSGFFVSADGYVVTNAHVVHDDTAEYTVFSNDGTKYDAKVIAKDTVLDIALLKVDAKDAKFLAFANSDEVQVGESVIAIGNALGEYRNTVSAGIVSGLARSVLASTGYGGAETLPNVIQTDAAINPGNSGGPLLDLYGNVIGVNVAASAGSAENIGFALPANAVKKAIDSIRENGRVIRPYIGVRYVPVTQEIKDSNNLDVDYGALVLRGAKAGDLAVIPGSPADKAGIEENDIILEINGEKVTADVPMANIINAHAVGEKLKLKILHDGKEKTVELTLEEQK